MVEEYNPDLRASDNKLVVGTGLALLGSRCGLGNDYFLLEGASGVAAAKTATEVISEDSDLFRNVRKHSNAIVPAVQRIAAGALALARTIQGADVPDDPGVITVTLDDSVIEDRAAKKKADLADVASGIMPPWEYRAKWYGEEEAAAKRMVAEAQGLLAPEL
jgi:A118 family predicted phage portal protein